MPLSKISQTAIGRLASINKRVVSSVHVDTGERVCLQGPTGTIESVEPSDDGRYQMVTIVTDDGYRCSMPDIMGNVTVH